MFITTLLLSFLATLPASSLPTESEQKRALPSYARFNLTATSPTDVQNLQVLASRNNFFLGTKGQDAVCDASEPWNTPVPIADDERSATFYLNDGELRLYTAQHTGYTVFVDRSGMGMYTNFHFYDGVSLQIADTYMRLGQGALGYITRNNALPPRFETRGWTLKDNNEVVFNGKGLLACPGVYVGGWPAWNLRLQGSESNPIWSDCVRVVVVAKEVEHAIACEYSASV